MSAENRSACKRTSTARGRGPNRADLLRVLVVDRDSQFISMLSKCLSGCGGVEILHAENLQEARKQLDGTTIDLALIESTLPDGAGLELISQLNPDRGQTQVVITSPEPNSTELIDAMRAGASDCLTKPIGIKDLRRCLDRVMDRLDRVRLRRRRVTRLRRLCRKLHQGREDVIQQVDVLCTDLVNAYQELANQVQQVVQTSQYSSLVAEELDLEVLLRKTLEYLLEQAGPTNMAIFLPSYADEHSLGGYVNYDNTAEANDLVLQTLADNTAPPMSTRDGPVHITDNDTLVEWMGEESSLLADRHVVAFPCQHDGESLAVVVMYRDRTQPFRHALLETCTSMGPMIGKYLAKVIRVHHRHLSDMGEAGEKFWI